MSRCKDCVHFVACVDFWYSDYDCSDNIEQSKEKHANNEACIHFKATADVVEVRHGEWIDAHTDTLYRLKCSLCGNVRIGRWTNYCCNCGAKMDGERREENEG